MKTLTNSEFKKYLKGLIITHYCDSSTAQDECGEVLSIIRGNAEFSEGAMIDRVEYALTESQKDSIYKLLSEDKIKYDNCGVSFDQDDRMHATSLIYS